MKPHSANHGFPGSITGLRRPRRLLVVLASTVIVFACSRRGGEVPGETAATDLTPTAMTLEAVAPVATLQKVINEDGVTTTGVARGVRVVREGKDLTPELGMDLREGDRIVTDRQTRVVMGSKSGSEILLDPDSDLTAGKQSIFLKLGNLFLKLKESFRLETEYVVAGVEGTELTFSVGSGDVVSLAVLEGKVRVDSKRERWSTRTYGEGEQGVIRGEAQPVKRPLDDGARKRLLQWVEDFERPVQRKSEGAGVPR